MRRGAEMMRFGSILTTGALLLSADVTGVTRLRVVSKRQVDIPASESLPSLPDFDTKDSKSTSAAAQDSQPARGPVLTDESRLALVRYVDGEIARVVVAIPSGKDGFHIKAGAPVDD